MDAQPGRFIKVKDKGDMISTRTEFCHRAVLEFLKLEETRGILGAWWPQEPRIRAHVPGNGAILSLVLAATSIIISSGSLPKLRNSAPLPPLGS